MNKLFVCLCILVTLVGCARRNSAADFTLKEQKKAAEALVDRVTNGRGDEFEVVLTPQQTDVQDWFSYYVVK